MTSALRQAYEARRASGALAFDAAQADALEALVDLETALKGRVLGAWRRPEGRRGVYLWGPVGRGKSMLMDLFFDAAPVRRKRRVHFHVFMAEAHRLVNAWRTGDAPARRAAFGTAGGDDPIAPVAGLIARSASLLCFDELQVTDIADAMILGRLFAALFERGVTLVATSNRAPDALYHDGVNRQLFLPFIAMLKAHTRIVAVDGPLDHRQDRPRGERAWFSPIDLDTERDFDARWRAVLGGETEDGVTLEVLGRRQHWPRAAGRRLRAHFASLCGHALGPEDYLAIAGAFDIVFVEAVPKLGPDKRDEARRLAMLVDTLYEARRGLVALAAGEPETIYPAGDQAFEFERTASRLLEMRSGDWPALTPPAVGLEEPPRV